MILWLLKGYINFWLNMVIKYNDNNKMKVELKVMAKAIIFLSTAEATATGTNSSWQSNQSETSHQFF
jgi:hypothetical protein